MTILFVGDSLIEYHDWQKRFPSERVVNLGLSGETVEGLLSRVSSMRKVCDGADVVVVMSGINNVAMGDVSFIDFYRVIIERLGEIYPKARIIVQSLLPTLVEFIDNREIQKVNEALSNTSHASGADFLDLYSLFTGHNGRPNGEYLSDDGVHLSPEGYRLWSDRLEQIMKA